MWPSSTGCLHPVHVTPTHPCSQIEDPVAAGAALLSKGYLSYPSHGDCPQLLQALTHAKVRHNRLQAVLPCLLHMWRTMHAAATIFTMLQLCCMLVHMPALEAVAPYHGYLFI